MSRRAITDEVASFIKENYMNVPTMDIARKFGISRSAVYSYKRRHGYNMPIEVAYKIRADRQRKPFTEEETDKIIEMLKTMTIREIADEMGRCRSLISAKIKEIGLGHIIEEKKKIGRFKKGQVAHNKGKKMPDSVREKVKHTFFKKGLIPHNTHKVGKEVIDRDGYTRVKIAKPDVWEYKHRLIWEAHHGPIDKDYKIMFIDGDKTNMDIENLKKVSYEESMLLNSKHKLPDEIIPTVALIHQINNKLKSKKR